MPRCVACRSDAAACGPAAASLATGRGCEALRRPAAGGCLPGVTHAQMKAASKTERTCGRRVHVPQPRAPASGGCSRWGRSEVGALARTQLATRCCGRSVRDSGARCQSCCLTLHTDRGRLAAARRTELLRSACLNSVSVSTHQPRTAQRRAVSDSGACAREHRGRPTGLAAAAPVVAVARVASTHVAAGCSAAAGSLAVCS